MGAIIFNKFPMYRCNGGAEKAEMQCNDIKNLVFSLPASST